MKEEKVENRYAREYSVDNILQNQYSLFNPVGEYDYYATSKMLSWFVKHIIGAGKSLSEITILDAGCGDGRKTRILAELLGSSKNIKSFELVTEGVNYCNRVNGSIDCKKGNIIDEFPQYDIAFDAIMACCVFMFLLEEDEILKALSNIYSNLKEDGCFMWFEVNNKSHFDNKHKKSELGYNACEMDNLAFRAGFELIDSMSLFKEVNIRGKLISTYYLYPRWGMSLTELINKIPFLKPSFNARLYKKVEKCAEPH